MLATWRRAAARAALRQVAACRVALVRRTALAPALPAGRRARVAEREQRDIAGMPWRHPESLTRCLRGRYERQLDARKAELWPADEYEREL
jgi:hypothetical protein